MEERVADESQLENWFSADWEVLGKEGKVSREGEILDRGNVQSSEAGPQRRGPKT